MFCKIFLFNSVYIILGTKYDSGVRVLPWSSREKWVELHSEYNWANECEQIFHHRQSFQHVKTARGREGG